jgi:hypothetical protein
MIQLKTGDLDNVERKFVPLKMDKGKEYLNNLVYVNEYKIVQVFHEGIKYRKYEDSEQNKYTKNIKKNGITNVEEITEKEFNDILGKKSKEIRKTRKCYNDDGYNVDVDYFTEPVEFVLMEVSSGKKDLNKYIMPKGFMEVTNMDKYENSSIYNGSLTNMDTTIEDDREL